MSSLLARRTLLNVNRIPRRVAGRLASTSAGPSQSPSSVVRYLRVFSVWGSIAAASYTLGSLYPPTLAAYISPRVAPPPLHPQDPNHIAYVAALDDQLQHNPVIEQHRKSTDEKEWYEARPYLNIPEERRVNSLTGGALNGPGKLAVPPLIRAKRDGSEALVFVHVGTALCGHEGIVHGGLLATLLDETLGRQALINLPDKIGVTAYLHLNYRAPTKADQFLVIKTRLIEAKGRKSKVAGVIEDLQGNPLVEAEGLFIQPKYANLLNTQRMRELLGEPDDSRELITQGAVAPVPVAAPGSAPLVTEKKA